MCFTASCKNARFYLCATLVSVSGLGWKRGGHQLMCTAVCCSKDGRRTLKRTDNCVHYGAFKIEIAKECKPTDQIVCPRFVCVLFIEWAQWQPLMYSHRCYRHQAALFLVSVLCNQPSDSVITTVTTFCLLHNERVMQSCVVECW